MTSQLSILLIESDIVLRQLYTVKLAKSYKVYSATSAQEAIDVLDDDRKQADFIILDIKLGVNNGVEMIHEIRSYDDWLEIPIILLSSIPLSRIPTQRFTKYGVKKFLYKPATVPSDLLKSVNTVVEDTVTNEISN